MKVEFHPAADTEMRKEATSYENLLPGLGEAFLVEIERVCSLLSDHQALGPKLDAEHRRFPLRRFPFGLIYRVESSDRSCGPQPKTPGLLEEAKELAVDGLGQRV